MVSFHFLVFPSPTSTNGVRHRYTCSTLCYLNPDMLVELAKTAYRQVNPEFNKSPVRSSLTHPYTAFFTSRDPNYVGSIA